MPWDRETFRRYEMMVEEQYRLWRSVGRLGANAVEDVRKVQTLLTLLPPNFVPSRLSTATALPQTPVGMYLATITPQDLDLPWRRSIDGRMSPELAGAIFAFQISMKRGFPWCDGRVDRGGATFRGLCTNVTVFFEWLYDLRMQQARAEAVAALTRLYPLIGRLILMRRTVREVQELIAQLCNWSSAVRLLGG